MSSANALGRSQVVEKDRHFSTSEKKLPAKFRYGKFMASAGSFGWIVAQGASVRVSFDLIPTDALDYLRRKAFWISGVENQELLNSIRSGLTAAIQEGKSLREFVLEIRSLFEGKEVPFRADTVFRTNIFSAYSVGQLEQVSGMTDRFPMWRYSAVKDGRTRASHRALDGKVFRVGEGPMPPIDFNCRCTAIFLHQSEVARLGIEPDTVNLPPEIKQFDVRAEFERWLRQRVEQMDPRLREAVEEALV